MAIWTIVEAKENLRLWIEAEKAVAIAGQSYKIGTRSVTRANLSEIRRQIQFWRNEVDKLESGRKGGVRVIRAIPRDL